MMKNEPKTHGPDFPAAPPLNVNRSVSTGVQSQPWYQTFWFFISMPYLRFATAALTADLTVQHPKDAENDLGIHTATQAMQ